MIELLDGCAEFFKEYCDCVYGEKYDEAQWNYVKYFEKPVDGEGKNKGALVPKIVQLEYPALDDTGAVTTTTVQVPLITLVPVTASKIEKATVTAEFALEVINDELQISFPNKKISENATVGKLEIVISPQELTDGLELIIEGYANALKRQIT